VRHRGSDAVFISRGCYQCAPGWRSRRQSVRQQPMEIARVNIRCDDHGCATQCKRRRSLHIAAPYATRLDDVATLLRGSGRRGRLDCRRHRSIARASLEESRAVRSRAAQGQEALVISGTVAPAKPSFSGCNVAMAGTRLSFTSECNSVGAALMAEPLSDAFEAVGTDVRYRDRSRKRSYRGTAAEVRLLNREARDRVGHLTT